MRGVRSRCRAGTAAASAGSRPSRGRRGGHQRYRSVGGAQAADDDAEDVGEFRADQEKSLSVGLGRGDLQQRHDFAGGREPVLGDAVVRQFQEFFVADAGQEEDLDRGEGPKRFFFIGQVPSPPAGRLFSPGEVTCGLGGDGSAQRRLGAGDYSPRFSVLRRLEKVGGRAPTTIGGVDQRRDLLIPGRKNGCGNVPRPDNVSD